MKIKLDSSRFVDIKYNNTNFGTFVQGSTWCGFTQFKQLDGDQELYVLNNEGEFVVIKGTPDLIYEMSKCREVAENNELEILKNLIDEISVKRYGKNILKGLHREIVMDFMFRVSSAHFRGENITKAVMEELETIVRELENEVFTKKG